MVSFQFVFDLHIRNNRILNVGRSRWYSIDTMSAALQLRSRARQGRLAKDRVLHDITREDTYIENPPGPAVYIGAAKDIHLDTLQVTYTEKAILPRKTAAIVVENAASVRMQGLHVESEQQKVYAGVHIHDSVAKDNEGVTVEEIQISGPLTMETVVEDPN